MGGIAGATLAVRRSGGGGAKNDAMSSRKPTVGITADVSEANGRVKLDVGLAYARCVQRAGGTPVVLAPLMESVHEHASGCDAIVFTGGDDPAMECFGVASHPKITKLHPLRQEYELALLAALEERPEKPVLGVCLGMQLMCLRAGGAMDQYMPETMPTHARHWGMDHPIVTRGDGPVHLASGVVHSKHKQAIVEAGAMRVLATSDDGVIEAAADPGRRFYVGVQWHPERTDAPALGQAIFDQLVAACGREWGRW